MVLGECVVLLHEVLESLVDVGLQAIDELPVVEQFIANNKPHQLEPVK